MGLKLPFVPKIGSDFKKNVSFVPAPCTQRSWKSSVPFPAPCHKKPGSVQTRTEYAVICPQRYGPKCR